MGAARGFSKGPNGCSRSTEPLAGTDGLSALSTDPPEDLSPVRVGSLVPSVCSALLTRQTGLLVTTAAEARPEGMPAKAEKADDGLHWNTFTKQRAESASIMSPELEMNYEKLTTGIVNADAIGFGLAGAVGT